MIRWLFWEFTTGGVEQLFDLSKRPFASQQLIKDNANRKYIRSSGCTLRIRLLITGIKLRRPVMGIDVILNLVRNSRSSRAVLTNAGKIKVSQPSNATPGSQNRVRGNIAMNHLMLMSMLQRRQHTLDNLILLVSSKGKRRVV